MENDYREQWCKIFSSLLGNGQLYPSPISCAKCADEALEELKKRDKERFFDQPDKDYRS